jgi:opacity protein-like surface antigen
MRVRSITTCALGLAAALTVVASPLAAQDTTKLRRPADQRINISKGEVTTTRIDTVYVTRYDTVRVNNTVVRVDTVTVATPQPVVIGKVKGNMFWGLAAGPTRPYGNVDRVYTNGFHGLGVLGWESQNSPIGVRLDGGVSQLGREETLTGPTGGLSSSNVGSGTPLMMHLAADLKVAPLVFRGTKWYGIGGLNFNRYRGVALTTSNSKGPCDFNVRGECFENATTSWTSKFGFNFGAGVDFHIGSQDMFLEYRWLASRSNSSNTYTNPISLGVRYF